MPKDLVRVDVQPEYDRLCPEWMRPSVSPLRSRILITAGGRSVYAPGEQVDFLAGLLTDGKLEAGRVLKCVLQRDFHPEAEFDFTSRTVPQEISTVLERPGFVRLAISGEGVNAELGVGYAPEEIVPAPEVAGFDAFWAKQRLLLDAVSPEVLKFEKVPLDDPTYEGKVLCYDVEIACAGAKPVSGLLALPAGAEPGTLPGYVFFHGAGVRSAFQPLTWAAHGMIAFNVNAHGLPNRRPEAYYRGLAEGELKEYAGRIYADPEESLFRDMTLRVVRALEFLRSCPEWNGKVLVVHGGSQGGYQALAAAALDPAVTLMVANAPAMCNLAGALEGRTPSWPLTVKSGRENRAALFFDGATFARRAKCEGVFTVGFSDSAAVPSSVYAAYNNYGGPKRMLDFPDCGHDGAVFWTAEAEILEHIKIN